MIKFIFPPPFKENFLKKKVFFVKSGLTTYLTDNSDKKIKEVDNGIRFTSYQRSSCPAEYVTYYDGKNEELKIEELKAFRNHTEKQLGIRIDNAIIKNLNFTKISNATFF